MECGVAGPRAAPAETERGAAQARGSTRSKNAARGRSTPVQPRPGRFTTDVTTKAATPSARLFQNEEVGDYGSTGVASDVAVGRPAPSVARDVRARAMIQPISLIQDAA